MTTTWNASDKGANVTLSGGNLTASSNPSGAVRATASFASGLWYWEVTIGATANEAIGLGNSSASLSSNAMGATADSIGYRGGTGGIFGNGVDIIAGMPTVAVADVIGVAADIGNKSFWVRKNSGNWNNDAGANPATNTGGASFSFSTGAFFPFWSGNVGAGTVNFGATSFVNSVPSGFSGIDGGAAAAGPSMMMLGIGS